MIKFFIINKYDQTHGINDLRVFFAKKKIPNFADKPTTKYLKKTFGYCFKNNPKNQNL